MTVEINNRTRSRIDEKFITRVAEKFFSRYKINKDLSIAFVGDQAMRRLNRGYRGQDKVTDILSFESAEKSELGEIVIDYMQIKRQSKKYSKSVKEELVFILVHGLLHLAGYDDDTEKKRSEMIKLGERFIKNYI